jgi:ComF family protein
MPEDNHRSSHPRVWRFLQQLTHLIARPVCALCNGDGQQLNELWGLDLCIHCERACPVVANPCPRCGEPLDATRAADASVQRHAQCASCEQDPPVFDATFSLFRYADPVDLMITQLKFHHELVYARVLGMLFAYAHRASGRALPDCVIPLPLHISRLRERGFCQTTEITRHAARRLQCSSDHRLPVRRDLLQRVRATSAQSELSAAARERNLRAAFRVPPGAVPPPFVAVLDDVMTTGHTAEAAALALKVAGCQRVEIWCCARAVHSQPAPTGRPPA